MADQKTNGNPRLPCASFLELCRDLAAPVSGRIQRISLLPHDGETAEDFHRKRINEHASMKFPDGTRMPIVTRAPFDASSRHMYTTAPDIYFAHDMPPLEGVYRGGKRRPPLTIPELPQYLRGWTPQGHMVSSTEGKVEHILENAREHWFLPAAGISAMDLIMWPLSLSSRDLVHHANWNSGLEKEKLGNIALQHVVTASCIFSWLQVWGILMGRFLYQQDGGARQTWPLVITVHEVSCPLAGETTEWMCNDRVTSARYSHAIFSHFTVFAELIRRRDEANGAWSRVTTEEVNLHVQQWCSFLANHTMADGMLAWGLFNHNNEWTFQACQSFSYKRHQWFFTRHFTSHQLIQLAPPNPNPPEPPAANGNNTEEKKKAVTTPAQSKVQMYRLVQNTVFPMTLFPKGSRGCTLQVVSHPVLRPGAPIFASCLVPLHALSAPEGISKACAKYGQAGLVGALQVMWSLVGCLTVDTREKHFFRLLCQPSSGGLFDTIMQSISQPITHSMPQSVGRAAAANAGPIRIAGLCSPQAGPRNEGRLVRVEVETAVHQQLQQRKKRKNSGEDERPLAAPRTSGTGFQWLVHVGDGRPLTIQRHSPFMNRQYLAALDFNMPPGLAEYTWPQNHQSFYAPDLSVDLATFFNYFKASYTTSEGQARNCELLDLAPKLQVPDDLAIAFFHISLRAPNGQLSEYNVWSALLHWFIDACGKHTGKQVAVNQTLIVNFWRAFARSYYALMHRVALAVTTWLRQAIDHQPSLTARQETLGAWLQIEHFVAEHRMDAWHIDSKDTTRVLRGMIVDFFKKRIPDWGHTTSAHLVGGDDGMTQSRHQQCWMLFFFLVHVTQPASLPPAYFSMHTDSQCLERIYAMHTLQNMYSDPARDLLNTAASRLACGNTICTGDVACVWRRYAAHNSLPEEPMEQYLVEHLLKISNRGEGMMALLRTYIGAHTESIFIRQEIPSPPKTVPFTLALLEDDCDDSLMDPGMLTDLVPSSRMSSTGSNSKPMDDTMLMESLELLLEPSVTIFIVAQTAAEFTCCTNVYNAFFREDMIGFVHVKDPTIQNSVPREMTGFVWVRGFADWVTVPHVFRPFTL